MRSQQVLTDSFTWTLPSTSELLQDDETVEAPTLEYVAGIDIAVKNDRAVLCMAIQRGSGGAVFYMQREVDLDEPYKAGFLAFREAPAILSVLEEVKEKHPKYYPQVQYLGHVNNSVINILKAVDDTREWDVAFQEIWTRESCWCSCWYFR